MSNLVTIGELSLNTGVPTKTIRYYEETGLIPKAQRRPNGYRVYGERATHLLRFIKHARDLGFSVHDVGELLALWNNKKRKSENVKRLAEAHLQSIDQKISELQELRQTLTHLVNCCQGDERPDCPILEGLAG